MAGSGLKRTLAALAMLSVAVLVLGACSSSDGGDTTASGTAGGSRKFEERKVSFGGLDVIVIPTQLDAGGAAFKVTFDTHTGAPEIDVAANSALEVDGKVWGSPVWSGDSAGGHHRTGTLKFAPEGTAQREARLSITGLDQPVEMTWPLGG